MLSIQQIDLKTAAKQSLLSFAVSLLSPNRVGEYGAKVLFYPKELQKKVFSLSVIDTGAQLIITLVFGFAVLLYRFFVLQTLEIDLKITYIILFILGFALLFFTIVRLQRQKKRLFFDYQIWGKAIGYSLVRYLIFSTQFFILLQFLQNGINYWQIMPLIYLTYFFSSFIPMMAFLDWTVKGGVALWVFKGVLAQDIIMQSIGLMWIFNFLLPFFAGSVYLYRQRFFTHEQ